MGGRDGKSLSKYHMKRMTAVEKFRVEQILNRLDEEYSKEYRCYLHYDTPWQLLVATILSAQCTDARVNMVTPDLFERYSTIEAMAGAELSELEKVIHSTGFYQNKAKNLIACANQILIRFDGEIPRSIEDLTSLAGVGRKTANVIRGNIFHEPSIVVDTHVKRVSHRLGLTTQNTPEKIEYELMHVLPKDHWILYNIHIIALGRTFCNARKPQCEICFLNQYCPYAH
jgi:endonuclease-3